MQKLDPRVHKTISNELSYDFRGIACYWLNLETKKLTISSMTMPPTSSLEALKDHIDSLAATVAYMEAVLRLS